MTISGDYSRILAASITVSVHAMYLVIRGVHWYENDSGIRLISGSEIVGQRRDLTNIVNAVKGEPTYQEFITINEYTVGQVIENYAAQNSGVNINAYPYIYAIILKRL